MFTPELVNRQDDLSGNQPPWRAVIDQRPIGFARDLRSYENGSNQSMPPQAVIEPLLVIEHSQQFDEPMQIIGTASAIRQFARIEDIDQI